jgi:hypothetical protein
LNLLSFASPAPEFCFLQENRSQQSLFSPSLRRNRSPFGFNSVLARNDETTEHYGQIGSINRETRRGAIVTELCRDIRSVFTAL